MTDRAEAVARAQSLWDDGTFLADLRRYVVIPTESQEPERHPDLRRYLTDEEYEPRRAAAPRLRCGRKFAAGS